MKPGSSKSTTSSSSSSQGNKPASSYGQTKVTTANSKTSGSTIITSNS